MHDSMQCISYVLVPTVTCWHLPVVPACWQQGSTDCHHSKLLPCCLTTNACALLQVFCCSKVCEGWLGAIGSALGFSQYVEARASGLHVLLVLAGKPDCVSADICQTCAHNEAASDFVHLCAC